MDLNTYSQNNKMIWRQTVQHALKTFLPHSLLFFSVFYSLYFRGDDGVDQVNLSYYIRDLEAIEVISSVQQLMLFVFCLKSEKVPPIYIATDGHQTTNYLK